MNKDELKGKGRQLKGAIKQEAGLRTRNPRLVSEGDDERAAGEVQEAYGRGRRKAGEAIERVGRKVKR
jgi:uncharacterized protein YjbJ (UPF0337 family)